MHSSAPFKWNLSVIFLHSNITMIAYLVALISGMFALPSLHSALAQESSFVTSKPVIKILVGDAVTPLFNSPGLLNISIGKTIREYV